MTAVATLTFALLFVTAGDTGSSNPTISWAVPIVTAVIVLAGTIAGLIMNKQTAGQRLAFERSQWEATESERRWKADREEEERRRVAHREEEERARAHAVEVQTAVESKCGECMEEVRRLIGDLDAATGRLLAAHRLIGQKDARIESLEEELLKERDPRNGRSN